MIDPFGLDAKFSLTGAFYTDEKNVVPGRFFGIVVKAELDVSFCCAPGYSFSQQYSFLNSAINLWNSVGWFVPDALSKYHLPNKTAVRLDVFVNATDRNDHQLGDKDANNVPWNLVYTDGSALGQDRNYAWYNYFHDPWVYSALGFAATADDLAGIRSDSPKTFMVLFDRRIAGATVPGIKPESLPRAAFAHEFGHLLGAPDTKDLHNLMNYASPALGVSGGNIISIIENAKLWPGILKAVQRYGWFQN